jgi:propanol-preferring alcohol dehydrogenase
MKAAVFHPSTGLTIRRVKVPRIGKKEVLVKLKAAGICASDIHYMEGFLMYSKIPIIPGHEGSGVIEEVGEGVINVGPGDRVVVHYVTACGECMYCLAGKENLCKSARLVGFDLKKFWRVGTLPCFLRSLLLGLGTPSKLLLVGLGHFLSI